MVVAAMTVTRCDAHDGMDGNKNALANSNADIETRADSATAAI